MKHTDNSVYFTADQVPQASAISPKIGIMPQVPRFKRGTVASEKTNPSSKGEARGLSRRLGFRARENCHKLLYAPISAALKRDFFIRQAFFLFQVSKQLVAVEYLKGRLLEVFLIARDNSIDFQPERTLIGTGILKIIPRRIESSIDIGLGKRTDTGLPT